MNKVLITGVAGYIGFELAQRILDAGLSLVGVDSFDETLYGADNRRAKVEKLQLNNNFEFHEFDFSLGSPEPFEIREIKTVYNLMAVPGLVPSWTHFDSYLKSNVSATKSLLDILSKSSETFLIHASTSSVYGDTSSSGPNVLLDPKSPYGISKLAAENLIRAYGREFGAHYSILRYFSVYGKDQRPDMAYSKFCKALLRNEPITINGDGLQVRTNTHVDDVVKATLLAGSKELHELTVDIAGSQQIKLLDAVKIIADELNVEPDLRFTERVAGDQMESHGDFENTQSRLGWMAEREFEEGIREQTKIAKRSLE